MPAQMGFISNGGGPNGVKAAEFRFRNGTVASLAADANGNPNNIISEDNNAGETDMIDCRLLWRQSCGFVDWTSVMKMTSSDTKPDIDSSNRVHSRKKSPFTSPQTVSAGFPVYRSVATQTETDAEDDAPLPTTDDDETDDIERRLSDAGDGHYDTLQTGNCAVGDYESLDDVTALRSPVGVLTGNGCRGTPSSSSNSSGRIQSPNTMLSVNNRDNGQGYDVNSDSSDDSSCALFLEVTLKKTAVDEKIGLTLFYRDEVDGTTCAFVGEIDPDGIAAKDGRIQRGDQIIKVDGVDLRSRQQAIHMFALRRLFISLTIARRRNDPIWSPATPGQHLGDATLLSIIPASNADDGFLDDTSFFDVRQKMSLVASSRRVPHPSFHLHAKILECIDEENDDEDDDDVTTDGTATTDFSGSNRHEDSGVGRTDDSTRNEESSEQELPDVDGAASLQSSKGDRKNVGRSAAMFRNGVIGPLRGLKNIRHEPHDSVAFAGGGGGGRRYGMLADEGDPYVENVEDYDEILDDDEEAVVFDGRLGYGQDDDEDEGPSPDQCKQFYAMLKERCNAGLLRQSADDPETSVSNRNKNTSGREDATPSPTTSLQPPPIPPRSSAMKVADVTSPPAKTVVSPLPDTCAAGCLAGFVCGGVGRRPVPRMGTKMDPVANSVSKPGQQQQQPPIVSRPEAQVQRKSSPLLVKSPPPRQNDEEGSEYCSLVQSPSTPRGGVGYKTPADTDSSASTANTMIEKNRMHLQQRYHPEITANTPSSAVVTENGEDTSPDVGGREHVDAYRRCGADVMLTNRANLRHTIAIQQSLFQQQMMADLRNGASVVHRQPMMTSSKSFQLPSHIAVVDRQFASGSVAKSSAATNHAAAAAARPTDLQLPASSLSKPHSGFENGLTTATAKSSNTPAAATTTTTTTTAETGEKYEWVVKRRSDGSRYVTRRPVKTPTGNGSSRRHNQKASSSSKDRDRERAAKSGGGRDCSGVPRSSRRAVAEERRVSRREVGCSTDDDDGSVVSEVKVGRYWTREQRRQHVEQRREKNALQQQKRAEQAAALASTVAVDVNRRIPVSNSKHWTLVTPASPTTDPKAAGMPFDGFVTVDELLARGSRGSIALDRNTRGQFQQQLLSVTTV